MRMMDDGMQANALTDKRLERIELEFCRGLIEECDIGLLIAALRVHRKVLKVLFDKFATDPGTTHAVTNPVANSELTYLKELVAMENPPDC